MSSLEQQTLKREKRYRLAQAVGTATLSSVIVIVVSVFCSGFVESAVSTEVSSTFLIAMCSFAAMLWVVLVVRGFLKALKN